MTSSSLEELKKENKVNLNDWIVVGSRLRCHFVRNKKSNEVVLISMCWGTVHTNDIEDCECTLHHSTTQTKQDLIIENQALKKENLELQNQITELQNKLICQKIK